MPDLQHELSHSNEEISALYQNQQAFFKSGVTRSLQFRKGMIGTLKMAIKRYEKELIDALQKDLRKSEFESYGTELGPIYAEIDHTLKHLRTWMQPERPATPLLFFPSKSVVYPDPLGVNLIISTWNYPVMLTFEPLTAAIAGGNTAIIKPSEVAPHTAEIITKIIDSTFEPEFIAVINGPGHLIGPALIEPHHLDHIFFTGSTNVGKKIMEMAAKQLTPVTLELGGKSPCIVAEDANLDFAAKKIAWAKTINAGQTCVAPDYVLVHENIKAKFLEKLKAVIDKMYQGKPGESKDFGRMINQRRYSTVLGYLQAGNIVYGGETNADDLYIGPAIIDSVSADSVLMKEEIFGPILPIVSYSKNEEVLSWVEKNPYPLALYVFTESNANADFFMQHIRFGGGCVNNCLIHLASSTIPFGGAGYSGLGQYHGLDGFKTFTRRKSIIKTSTWFDAPLWYPPYKNNVKWLRKYFG